MVDAIRGPNQVLRPAEIAGIRRAGDRRDQTGRGQPEQGRRRPRGAPDDRPDEAPPHQEDALRSQTTSASDDDAAEAEEAGKRKGRFLDVRL